MNEPQYEKLFLVPYSRYQFWRKLQHCKTWGELLALCQGEPALPGSEVYGFGAFHHSAKEDFCDMLIERYKRAKWLTRSEDCYSDDEEEFDYEKHARLTEDTQIDADYFGDFDCSCHDDGKTHLYCGIFPPLIEQIMYHEATTADGGAHKWMFDVGETMCPGDVFGGDSDFDPFLDIRYEKKDAVFKKISELGGTVEHCPNLLKEFRTPFIGF